MKDESFVKLLNTVGAETPILTGENIQLPSWLDAEKAKRGQTAIGLSSVPALVRLIYFTLLAIEFNINNLNVVLFTKQSSTPKMAYRRYKMNFLHAKIQGDHEVKPGSPSWKSFEQIRGVHNHVNGRLKKAGMKFISQRDLAILHFLTIGFQSLYKERVGIYMNEEQWEDYNHYCRLSGHMVGLEDRFNCCGDTLKETQAKCQAMLEDCFNVGLQNLPEKFHPYARSAAAGMWYMIPYTNYDSAFYHINRLCKVPGYTCLQYKQLTHFNCKDADCKFKELPLLSKIHALGDIFIFEVISQIPFWRAFAAFFLAPMFIISTHVFPLLAIIAFGWSWAFCNIVERDFKKMNKEE